MARLAKSFFQVVNNPYKVMRIKPDSSVRNWQTADIAKSIADGFRPPLERLYIENPRQLRYRPVDNITWEIDFTERCINFLLSVPVDRVEVWHRRLAGIWDRATITIDDKYIDDWDTNKTTAIELLTVKHDMYSLHVDHRDNLPLPSLLQAVKTLNSGDKAKLFALFQPVGHLEWKMIADEAWEKLRNGRQPVKNLRDIKTVSKLILTATGQIIQETMLGIAEMIKSDNQENIYKRKEVDPEAGQLAIENLTVASKQKRALSTMRTFLWVLVQSDNKARRENIARTIAGAFTDLSADNEFTAKEVKSKKRKMALIETVTNKKLPPAKFNCSILSTAEVGKIIQLPGRELQEEFKQVESIKVREIQLPKELHIDGLKAVRLGFVTERGTETLARIPLEAYPGVKLKHVYDALCTASFGQGKQGTGKTDGYGSTWAYDMVMAGFSAIIIDTADGQVLKDFVNALPKDYPEDKLHLLDLDNKAWPIPLGWEDVYGRNFAEANGDEELAAMEIQERLTARFIGFINSLSSTGEFTDRMAQYVISCMRAITTTPGWSFLDLELALTSPAYRQELLKLEKIQNMPEVVRDLMSLQDRAEKGTDGSVIDPIMSRVRVLTSTQFMANLFYQRPKLGKSNKPVLDLRKIMDNPEGGYGHVVCIKASGDAWQENQATILGFFLDKINFNAFSRVDQDQADRKPCLVWIDEPHKVIKAIEGKLSGTAVEFRKYRVKNLFTGHSIDQMGAAADALLDGGAQVTSYKTERLSELSRYAHMFKPYDDAKELYEMLPEKWVAVNSVRLPSGKPCPAFIAQMVEPPKHVVDRSHCWEISAQKYGRPWREVTKEIQAKRGKYRELDANWLTARMEERRAEKEAKKK